MLAAKSDGYTEGCVCGKLKDGKLKGIITVEDSSCVHQKTSSGAYKCGTAGTKSGAVWCYRGKPSENKFDDVQYAPWCATFSMLAEDRVGIEERSCLVPHYFACQQKVPDTCEPPRVPTNATTLYEDWRVGGRGVLIRCDEGYGFDGEAVFEGFTACVKSPLGPNIWQPNPLYWKCERLPCTDPPGVSNATLQTSRPLHGFKYQDNITYSCETGRTFDRVPMAFTANSQCNSTQHWQPDPAHFECLVTTCKYPPRVANAKYVGDKFTYASEVAYVCLDGFWIKRGNHNVTGFNCSIDSIWVPNPLETVFCVDLICNEPQPPPHGSMIVTSYRYLAKIKVTCDYGYSHVDTRREVTCDKYGDWTPDPSKPWCENITCPTPPSGGEGTYLSSSNKTTYMFSDRLQYMCNRTGYDVRRSFEIYNPHTDECLYAERDKVIKPFKECLWKDLSYTWIWEGEHLLRMAGTEYCMTADEDTGEGSGGPTSDIILKKCDPDNQRQRWHCPESGGNKLLLSLMDTLPPVYVRVIKDQHKVQAVSEANTTDPFGSWLIHNVAVDLDICAYIDGFPTSESVCNRYGQWSPSPTDVQCVIQRCPVLPDIEGTTHELVGGEGRYFDAKVTYRCEVGKSVTRDNVTITFTCDETGNWSPSLDVIQCLDVICPSPPAIRHADIRGILWTYQQTISYSCATGYWVKKDVYHFETKCTADAMWDPDPATFACNPVECPDPGEPDHASYTYKPPVGYGHVIGYTCDDGYWYRRGEKSTTIKCLQYGTYSPDPSYNKCIKTTCLTPGYVASAYNTEPKAFNHVYHAGDTVTYKCYHGTWISAGKLTVTIKCNNDGEWDPAPNKVFCESVMCGRPDPVQHSVIKGWGNYVGSSRTVQCNEGFWIDQSNLLDRRILQCSVQDGLWHPEIVRCKVAKCPDPTTPQGAHYLRRPGTFSFNETVVYECDEGHHVGTIGDSTTLLSMTCQADGVWKPDHSKSICEKKICLFSEYNLFHMKLSQSLNGTFKYNDTILATCDDGYWFLTENKAKVVGFFCDRNGHFVPEPEFTMCTVVECPAPLLRPNSVMHGTQFDYNSTVTYECLTGHASEELVDKWEFRCKMSGQWDHEFAVVDCRPRDCGDPGEIENGLKLGERYLYGNVVTFKCDIGKWFRRDTFEYKIQCQPNGQWSSFPPPCTDVTCLKPSSLVQNARFYGKKLLYQSLVTIVCLKGFHIRPGHSRVTIRCAKTGHWDKPISDFSCTPISCEEPDFVWHAAMIGTDFSSGASVTFQCDSGYFLSRNKTRTSVSCSKIGRWVPEPASIICLPRTSFLCDPPAVELVNAYYLASSFAYMSVINVTCWNGFWLSRLNYSTSLKCTLEGTWFPPVKVIRCHRIICKSPAAIAHGTYTGTDYSFNSVIHLECRSASLVTSANIMKGKSVQTEHTSTTLICGIGGNWIPDPKSITCTTVDCSSPAIPAHSSIVETKIQTVLGSKLTVRCDKGFFMKKDVLSMMTKCTLTGRWQPDPALMSCIAVTCGAHPQSGNSSIFGESTDYGAVLTYECDEGFHARVFGSEDTFVRSQKTECLGDGTWQDGRMIKDCEPIKCSDPGHLPSSVRYPAAPQKHDHQAEVRYVCNTGTRFTKGNDETKITCSIDGKWFPGDAKMIPPCVDVKCTRAPSIPFADGSPEDRINFGVGETVVYFCNDGFQFKIRPAQGYYTAECRPSGMWTPFPDGASCEHIDCQAPPSIPDSSFLLKNGTTYVGDAAIYSCEHGYKLDRTVASINLTQFSVRCDKTALWNPDPMQYSCKAIQCEEPPENISNAVKHGNVYDYGHYVSYVCNPGYGLRDPVTSVVKEGSVPVQCLITGKWSTPISSINCEALHCDYPYIPDNSTSTEVMTKFGSEIKITCDHGYFLNETAPPETEETMTCKEDRKWHPDPLSLACKPFNCGDPGDVENAITEGYGTTFTAVVRYHCNIGYVVDVGNGGFITDYPPLRTATIKCSDKLTWQPQPSAVKCARIQCPIPRAPPRAYISGGEWINDKMSFFHGSTAIARCAKGYIIERTRSVTDEAECLINGQWDRNLTLVYCERVVCTEPRDVKNSIRYWNGVTSYMSQVTYECRKGYFFKSGLTVITSQCAYEGNWRPATSISCKRVNCGDPGVLANADRKHLSGYQNYSFGAAIEYKCQPGFWIAKERDAVGKWVTDQSYSAESSSTTLTCGKEGRWSPMPVNVQCSEAYAGTTLKDMVDTARSEAVLPLKQGRTETGDEGGIQVRIPVGSKTALGSHCEHARFIVIRDYGQWLRPVSEEDVSTTTHYSIIEETGEHCGVWKMFDNDHSTYWKPLEAPSQAYHALFWRGWAVDLDLKQEHIIASIQLHTSENFENDVRAFTVSFSLTGSKWTTLGPFYAIMGPYRAEFFYGFEPLQARHIRLNVTSTALMKPPIVTEFSVYGSTVDCEMDESAASYSVIIPLFLITLLMVFAGLLYRAYDLDVKDRWRRYILFIPGGMDREKLDPKSKTFQLSILTSWKNRRHDVDLLFRIVGDDASYTTPITWLRHSYQGLMRPKFTDTAAVNFPTDIGFVKRIDIVSVCKQFKSLSKLPKPSGRVESNAESGSIRSELSSRVSSSGKSEIEILKPARISADVEQPALEGSHSMYNSDICIQKLVLKDPVTNVTKRWQAKRQKTSFWRFRSEPVGKFLSHGDVRSFFLSASSPEAEDDQSAMSRMKKTLFSIMRHHPMGWMMTSSKRVQSLTENLTRFEKVSYGMLLLFNGLLAEALIHGMSDSTIYFSSMSSGSGFHFVATWLQPLHLCLSAALFVTMFSLGKHLAKSWRRVIEDPVSYWQGTRACSTAYLMAKFAFPRIFKRKKPAAMYEKSSDKDSRTVENMYCNPYDSAEDQMLASLKNALLQAKTPKGTSWPGTEASTDEDLKVNKVWAEGERNITAKNAHAPGRLPCDREKQLRIFPYPSAGILDTGSSKASLEMTRAHVRQTNLQQNRVSRIMASYPSPVPRGKMPVDVPSSILSSLTNYKRYPRVVTHRLDPPENPFLGEGDDFLGHQQMRPRAILCRIFVVALVIVHVVITSLLIGVKSVDCSSTTSVELVTSFSISLMTVLLVVMPVSSGVATLISKCLRMK